MTSPITAEERALALAVPFVAKFVKAIPELNGHRMVQCDIEPMEEDLTDLIASAIREAEASLAAIYDKKIDALHRLYQPPVVQMLETQAMPPSSPDLTQEIIHEIYRLVERLGGKSDSLSIIGSWRDTMDDAWVLASLREWLEHTPTVPSPQAIREAEYAALERAAVAFEFAYPKALPLLKGSDVAKDLRSLKSTKETA